MSRVVTNGVLVLYAFMAWAVVACDSAGSDSDLDVRVAQESEQSMQSASTEDAGASDCPPTQVISDVSEKATASGAAVNTMVALCGRCHTPDGRERVPEGPANVADFNLMMDEGFAVDCSADRSAIIQTMRANEMGPPGHPVGPVNAFEIDVVAFFIEFLCTDEEKACAVDPSPAGCSSLMSARRERRCAGWRTP